MIRWPGHRKALTVLAFAGPTLLGVLLFNIYPMVFNTYISFTNRNQYHPNPDCAVGLTGLLEPSCWPIFRSGAPAGMGQPFRLREPLYGNYADVIGGLFSGPVLLAIARLLASLAPLWLAARLNRRWETNRSRPAGPGAVALGGAALTLALAWLLNVPQALDAIAGAGDLFVVTFRSVLYVALCIPLFLLVALTLALILNSPALHGRAFFRVALIVPWAASTVAIMMSLVWQFFFREHGTINQVLGLFGLKGQAWLSNPTWAFAITILVNVWYTYPFFMVTILGALQSIPSDYYEAAEVDGATYWDQLLHVTLPLLRPAVLPVIVLSSISTFQMFGTVWALTSGGPSRGAGAPGATELVMIYAYKQVFQTNAYGRMGAFAVIMFLLLFSATLYSLRVARLSRSAYEGAYA